MKSTGEHVHCLIPPPPIPKGSKSYLNGRGTETPNPLRREAPLSPGGG